MVFNLIKLMKNKIEMESLTLTVPDAFQNMGPLGMHVEINTSVNLQPIHFKVQKRGQNEKMTMPKQISINDLWSPLFDMFQNHFRRKFDNEHRHLIGKYDNWSQDEYRSHVNSFVRKYIELPKSLVSDLNIAKICSLLDAKPATDPLETVMWAFNEGLVKKNENMRTQFFADSIIQYLWGRIFIRDCE